ncbi:hypothetical protein DFH09DRAFT_1218092 [Mycena vulgaris]|nr:hypothetical protein DFH09DRAFT_1218092 [Mycena vulgaris]
MLAILFPIAALLASLNVVFAQGSSSIPGLTDGQGACLGLCIFAGLPAAPDCDANTETPDIACFCGSAAYTSNVTQCASAECNICTTGGCNITADPLTDQCNSATLSGSSASSSKTAAPLSGSGSSGSPTSTGPSSATSGSTSSAPSTTPTGAASAFNAAHMRQAMVIAAGLVLLGLTM